MGNEALIYTKFMLTPGVQWVQAESAMEPDGIYFRPLADSTSAAELAVQHDEDGFIGRPAVALMGFDPEGDRWEVLVVAYTSHGLVRKVRMMFGLALEWDGQNPVEFDRGEGIEMIEYSIDRGRTVISFHGLLTGMMAAISPDEKRRAKAIAARVGVAIQDET
ncbi:hypothetical protein [Sulfuricystis multivorans]|uniref:hypothetical protein n=1 Tax=Sulfuricystis multivorans TaxID=2211108 RepID=UPI000F83520D|nr:hypothetical protein [Sulfuricystis multivorans]